ARRCQHNPLAIRVDHFCFSRKAEARGLQVLDLHLRHGWSAAPVNSQGGPNMGIRRRSVAIFAVAAVGVVAIAAVAFAAPTSTFTFSMSPTNPPKTTYKNGTLATDLITSYTNPGNNNPGGAVQ